MWMAGGLEGHPLRSGTLAGLNRGPSVMGSWELEVRVGLNVPALQSCARLSGDEPHPGAPTGPPRIPSLAQTPGWVKGAHYK